MFDAKSILEGLVRGAAPQAQQQGGGGGLADILGEILKGGGQQQGGGGQSGSGQSGGGLGDILGEIGRMTNPKGVPVQPNAPQQGGGGGLADILAELQKHLGQGGQEGQAQVPAPSHRGAVEAPGGGGLGGGLGDILGQLKEQLGKAGGAVGSGQGAGGLADILGQVLGQATQGVKEGANRIGDATGAKDAFGRATGGQSTDELLEKLKGLVRDNPLAATGAAGGLGGLVLGTRAGRSIAGSAARIGALALIGGLAYKAFQNYQAGRPLIAGESPPEAAPAGSGFEPAAVTNESATLYIRAMIAAAAADGRIDAAEQAKIIASLKQGGVDAGAEEFLANELNNPASPQDLADAVTSPEEAVQLYTAARIAIEPDAAGEKQFLGALAAALGIDAKLASHIEATTRSAAV